MYNFLFFLSFYYFHFLDLLTLYSTIFYLTLYTLIQISFTLTPFDLNLNDIVRDRLLESCNSQTLPFNPKPCARQYEGLVYRPAGDIQELIHIPIVAELLIPTMQMAYEVSEGAIRLGEGHFAQVKVGYMYKKEQSAKKHKDRMNPVLRAIEAYRTLGQADGRLLVAVAQNVNCQRSWKIWKMPEHTGKFTGCFD